MQSQKVPFWKTAPFLRLLPPLIAGIILQYYSSLPVGFSFSVFLSALIFLFLWDKLPLHIQFRSNGLRGFLIYFMIMAAAMTVTAFRDVRHDKDWVGKKYLPGDLIICSITETPEEKQKSFRVIAEVVGLWRNDSFHVAKGNIYIYLKKDDKSSGIRAGDRLLLKASLQPLAAPANPGDFDFRRYASLLNIHHTCYSDSPRFLKIDYHSPSFFSRQIGKCREYIICLYREHIKGLEAGVAEALVIGYRYDLDKELLQAYSNTGVIHIIAISGLHLGLIYIMLQKLLRFFRMHKRKITGGLIVIISLWLFSFLTGASPSVLRSAVMFSFIVAGDMMSRKGNVQNSLAASAFFLLAWDPFLLWNTGFQLSHLAVAGIITLQQPLYRLLYLKNAAIMKIWSLASVTLAAQLFTIPACLLYFHQFPNFFLISNLIVVPLSSLVLFAGIIMVVLSPVSFLSSAIGWLLSLMIKAMNGVVSFINEIPGAVSSGFYPDFFQVMIYYAIAICFAAILLKKEVRWLMLSLCFILIASFYTAGLDINGMRQSKIIFYRIPGSGAVDFVDGDSLFCWSGAEKVPESARNAQGLGYPNENISMDSIKAVEWKEHPLLIIDSNAFPKLMNNIHKSPVLLLRHNSRIPIAYLDSLFRPHLIVMDASNKMWKIEKWMKECERLNLRCHSVPHLGSLILEQN